MLKRPKKISISGIEYTIKYLPASKMNSDLGSADFSTRTIKILETLDEDNASSTLLHEIIHVILYTSGQAELLGPTGDEVGDRREESLVLALEHGLHSLVELKCQQNVS